MYNVYTVHILPQLHITIFNVHTTIFLNKMLGQFDFKFINKIKPENEIRKYTYPRSQSLYAKNRNSRILVKWNTFLHD